MSPLLLLLLAIFLFPIAIYCMILGMINRRSQPLMVPGTWDFAGVLAATSGFLLFVGPALLTGTFRQSLRELPLQRDSPSLGDALAEIWATWWVMWIVYYLFVLVGAALLVWTRRHTTVIYNIQPHILQNVLLDAARRLGLDADWRGNRISFGVAETLSPSMETHISVNPGLAAEPHMGRVTSALAVVDVEALPLLNNVTLHWQNAPPEVRADLERELRKSCAGVLATDHAVGGWLIGIAAFLLFSIMLLTGLFIAMITFIRRP